MSIRIKGATFEQDVDSNGNANVVLPIVDTQAGFAAGLAENDAGTVTGYRSMRAMEVSTDFRLRTGQDNMILNEQFPSAVLNSSIWSAPVTTMTITLATGFATLNAGLSVAASAVAQLRTYRHFPCYKQYTTYAEMEVQFSQLPQSGNRCEWGLMLVSGTAAPTDGVFFRVSETGDFTCVMCYNGIETESASLDFATLVGASSTKSFLIYVGSTTVYFWIDNILVTSINVPSGQGSSTSSMNLPLSFRNYNTGAVSIAQTLKVGNVNVTFGDQAMSKPWGHVLAGAGAMANQGQTGSTLGSTAIYTNAAAAAAAALSNTTAAAPNVGLGGIVNVLPTLVAGTDGIVFSYQAPIGTAILPGRSLYITGCKISSVVTAALTGGGIIWAFSIAAGSTAVSLATAEAATTKAPRRIPLGFQVIDANAVAGVKPLDLQMDFSSSPIMVQSGEFIQIAARNLGIVTTVGTVTVICTFTGYWE